MDILSKETIKALLQDTEPSSHITEQTTKRLQLTIVKAIVNNQYTTALAYSLLLMVNFEYDYTEEQMSMEDFDGLPSYVTHFELIAMLVSDKLTEKSVNELVSCMNIVASRQESMTGIGDISLQELERDLSGEIERLNRRF